MLLTVSVGNSRTAFAVHRSDGEGLRAAFALHTDVRRTADELRIWLVDLLARDGLSPSDIDAVCLCSVVPAVTAVVADVCRSLFGRRPLVVGPGVRTGLAVHYRPVAALGADRLVDAVAAHAAHGGPVVVLDFGTATTINAVDGGGTFRGGAIAPGIGLAAEGLAEAGARLARVELGGPPPELVGRTTESALRSGLVHGQAALVEGLLARVLDALAGDAAADVPVVATGGWLGVVAPLVPRIDHRRPGLIHDGLRAIWQRQPARRAAACA